MTNLKYIILLLIICVSVRLLFFVAVEPWSPLVANSVMPLADDDTLDYHKLAVSIVNQHQFAKDGKIETLRTPLYPLFISFFYTLFGPKLWIVLLAQIFMDTASCILLFSILARSLNPVVGLYASLFYALDPFFIFFSNMLLSDVLFVFLCVLAFYFFSNAIIKRFEDRSVIDIFVSALFFGLATIVRPVAQYLPAFIVITLFVLLVKDMKKVVRLSVIFVLGFVISLSPWLIRNYIMFKSLSLSTSGAYNLIVLYVAPVEAEKRGQPAKVVEDELLDEADGLILRDGLIPGQLNEFEKAKYWQRLAIQYIKSDMPSFGKHYILGVFHLFANLGTRGYADMLQIQTQQKRFNVKDYPNIIDLAQQWFRQKTPAEIFLGICIGTYLLISYLSMIIGVLTAIRNNNRDFVFFCIAMVLYFVVVTGSAGIARFKLPIIPFYLGFSGIGLSIVASKIGIGLGNQECLART